MDEFPPEYVKASNAGRIVGVVGAFHFIALAFVSLRIYARLFMVRAFGADDALIIVVAALAFGSWLCLILQMPFGLGRHGLVIPVEDRMQFEQVAFWKTVLSDGVALGLLRISMAISLLRLKRDSGWYRWSLYAVIGFVVAYSIQAIAWLFVYCTPYSGWWEFQWMNPFDPRCRDFNIFLNLTYWNISCNIFTDVCLGALPIPIIWSLKMKRRVRIYVIAILNLGYFAVLMGILKAVFMLTTGGTPDAIFDYWVHFWENLQLNVGIMAACASFLKPLVGRLLKLNSSVGSYPTQPYSRTGGRTPGGAIGSNAYANRRRTANHGRSVHDGFELQSKNDTEMDEELASSVTTQPQASRSQLTSEHRPSADGGHGSRAESDTNSEEIILQKPSPAHGIVRTMTLL